MTLDKLQYIPIMFQKIFSNIWIKVVGALGYISTYQFFDPNNKAALYALFFLIFADLLTGVYASYKTGMEIKSAKILRTGLKIAIYYVMISAGHLTEVAGITFLPIEESLIGILAVTELISLLENCANVGYVVPQKLLNRLRDFRDK